MKTPCDTSNVITCQRLVSTVISLANTVFIRIRLLLPRVYNYLISCICILNSEYCVNEITTYKRNARANEWHWWDELSSSFCMRAKRCNVIVLLTRAQQFKLGTKVSIPMYFITMSWQVAIYNTFCNFCLPDMPCTINRIFSTIWSKFGWKAQKNSTFWTYIQHLQFLSATSFDSHFFFMWSVRSCKSYCHEQHMCLKSNNY